MPTDEEFDTYCKNFDAGKLPKTEFPRSTESGTDLVEIAEKIISDHSYTIDHFGLNVLTKFEEPVESYEYIPSYVGDDVVITTDLPQAAFAQFGVAEGMGLRVSIPQTGFSSDGYPLAERYIVSAPSIQSRPDGRNWNSSAKVGCGAPTLRAMNRTRKAGEKDGSLIPRVALATAIAENTPDYNPGYDSANMCCALCPVMLPREEANAVLSPADGGAMFCPFGVVQTAKNFSFKDPRRNTTFPIMEETVQFHNGVPGETTEHAKLAALGPLAGKKIPAGVLEGALLRLEERLAPHDWAMFESTDPAMDAVVYAGIKEELLITATDLDKTLRTDNIALAITGEDKITVDNIPHIEQETIDKYIGCPPLQVVTQQAWCALYIEYAKVARRTLQYSPSMMAGYPAYHSSVTNKGLPSLAESISQDPHLRRKQTVREVIQGGSMVHLTDIVPHDILLIQRNYRTLLIADDTELRSVVKCFGGSFMTGPSYLYLCTNKRRKTLEPGELGIEIYNALEPENWITLTAKEEGDLGLHIVGKPWQVRYDFPFLEALYKDLIVDAPGDTWLCPHVPGTGLVMRGMLKLPLSEYTNWKTRKKYSISSRINYLSQEVKDLVYEYYETQNDDAVSSDCESNRSDLILDYYSDD